MHLSPLSLLAVAATLAASVVGIPVAAADAVAPSQVPVPIVGAEPTVILGTPGKAAPISAEVETHDLDLKITKRSYTGTCNTCSLNANYLECKCRNLNNLELWSSLNLNKCIANANGVLVWRNNGGFYSSCGQNGWWSGLVGSKLQTACRNEAGNYVATKINFNARIHKYNGVLGCQV